MVIAAAGVLAYSYNMQLDPHPAALLAAVIGGVLPDIDHPDSLLGFFFRWVPGLKHRNQTHSLLAWTLVTALGFYLLGRRSDSYGLPAAYGLSWGYASHLAADMLTAQGIPLLAPFSKRRFVLPLVTNPAVESILAFVFFAMSLWWAFGPYEYDLLDLARMWIEKALSEHAGAVFMPPNRLPWPERVSLAT